MIAGNQRQPWQPEGIATEPLITFPYRIMGLFFICRASGSERILTLLADRLRGERLDYVVAHSSICNNGQSQLSIPTSGRAIKVKGAPSQGRTQVSRSTVATSVLTPGGMDRGELSVGSIRLWIRVEWGNPKGWSACLSGADGDYWN